MKTFGILILILSTCFCQQDNPWFVDLKTEDPNKELIDWFKGITTQRPGANPWFVGKTTAKGATTKKTTKTAIVPEDDLIVDLKVDKEIKLTCPEKKGIGFVLWYKITEDNPNGKELTLKAGKYDFPGFMEIIVKELSTDDEGVYYCKPPFNPEIIKRFQVIMLNEIITTPDTARVERPEWTVVPNAVKRVRNDRRAILPCRARGTDVKVTAYRLKDDGSIFKKLRDKGVALMQPSLSDSGKYKCTAENSEGKIEHQFEIVVVVNGGLSDWTKWGPCDKDCGFGIMERVRYCDSPAPANGGRSCSRYEETVERRSCKARSCSSPVLTKFGFEITDKYLIVHCHAKGFPQPTVQWRVGGRVPSAMFDHKSPTMKIPKTRAPKGSYSCTVRNRQGYFTMYITINQF